MEYALPLLFASAGTFFAANAFEEPKVTDDISVEEPSTESPIGSLSIAAPSIEAPSFAAPSIEAPSYAAPSFSAPKFEAPKYEAPTYGAPSFAAPSYGAPSWMPSFLGGPVSPVPEPKPVVPEPLPPVSPVPEPKPVVPEPLPPVSPVPEPNPVVPEPLPPVPPVPEPNPVVPEPLPPVPPVSEPNPEPQPDREKSKAAAKIASEKVVEASNKRANELRNPDIPPPPPVVIDSIPAPTPDTTLEPEIPIVDNGDLTSESPLAIEDTPHVVSEPLPTIEDNAPVVSEPLPAIKDTPPVVSEPLPAIEDKTPVVSELPSVPETLPVIEDKTPLVIEPPSVPETLPAIEGTPSVMSEPSSVPETIPPVVPEPPTVPIELPSPPIHPVTETQPKVQHGKCKSTYGPLYDKLISNRVKYDDMLKKNNITELAKELGYDTSDKSLAITERIRSKVNAILVACHPDKNAEDLENTKYIGDLLIKIKQLDPHIIGNIPVPSQVVEPAVETPAQPPVEPPVETPANLALPEIPTIQPVDNTIIESHSPRPARPNFENPSLAPEAPIAVPQAPPSPVITGNLGPIYTPMQQRFNASVNPNPVENVSHPGWMQGTTGHARVAYRRGTYRKHKKLLKKSRFAKTLKK